MYKLIAIISAIIRMFYLPNPFASLEYGTILNLIVEPLIYFVTYLIVGFFYRRGSAPALGSCLYLIFYVVHVYLIILCGIFNFSKASFIVIIGLYIAILGLLIGLKDKVFERHF